MKPPEECTNLEDVSLGIDTLDREVIALIGRRARYVEAAARFKTGESSVRAPERRQAMLETRRRWAEEEGLKPRRDRSGLRDPRHLLRGPRDGPLARYAALMKIVLDNTLPAARLGVTSGPPERVLTTARRRRFGRVIQVTNPA